MKKNIILFSVFLLAFFNTSKILAESTKYYVVQVGYYKNTVIMETDFNFFVKQGLPVYKVAHEGGYRIYLGNYENREEAEKAAQIVNEMGFETLIRTIEKKPTPNPTQPKKIDGGATDKAADKKTDIKTNDTTDKSTINTAQHNSENQTNKNVETTSSTYKVQLPQKKDNFSDTHRQFSQPNQLNEKSDTTNTSQNKLIHYMFYAMFMIILSIGTIAASKRNREK